MQADRNARLLAIVIRENDELTEENRRLAAELEVERIRLSVAHALLDREQACS